ncbi:hypothetical protein AMTR_s00003p00103190 [Amborella trichopoda]|uniref:Pentacotripeptide-repeat region of PRORP domain-containing protein n=1 Tax=Amborella trichopoda TaxID=13333 RepID=W1P834_AMBTC|nr:hypothetical protein AMTR_s00003p00103190 [Amborella trichopoda]
MQGYVRYCQPMRGQNNKQLIKTIAIISLSRSPYLQILHTGGALRAFIPTSHLLCHTNSCGFAYSQMKMSVLGVVKPSTSPTKQALISTPTAHQFITLLESKCTSMNHLKQIHAQITRHGLSQNNFLMASLVKFCAEPTSGNLNYARAVFNQLKDPHPFIWNTMIRGCSENNALEEAILFYCTMVQEDVQPNNFTFPSVFKACNGIKALKEGEQVHTHVIKHGLMSYGHVHSSMIQMYGSCGQLPNARRLFDRIHEPDVVSWNCLIDSHLKNGELEEAKELFQNMPFRIAQAELRSLT